MIGLVVALVPALLLGARPTASDAHSLHRTNFVRPIPREVHPIDDVVSGVESIPRPGNNDLLDDPIDAIATKLKGVPQGHTRDTDSMAVLVDERPRYMEAACYAFENITAWWNQQKQQGKAPSAYQTYGWTPEQWEKFLDVTLFRVVPQGTPVTVVYKTVHQMNTLLDLSNRPLWQIALWAGLCGMQ